ncbi:DHH family phosphoesterase [candidate division WOR-3 bacterium]|nr:DHH family phosphoesterase [candidate division WOR-3 bacterium]
MSGAEVLSRIRKANRFWVAGHIGPDGDTITSVLLAGRLLRYLGKEYGLYIADSTPEKFAFLSGIEDVRPERPDFDPDVLLTLDAPNLTRVALEDFPSLYPSAQIINIDHHLSNEGFGDVNWVELDRGAACLMVLELLRAAGAAVSREEGEMVFTGLFTETGGFVFPNATREVFEVCAEAVRLGVGTSDIAIRMTARDERNLALLGKILSGMKTEDGIAVIELTEKMLSEVDLDHAEEDTDSYIRYPTSIPGIKITIFFRELADLGEVRISFRSLAGVDVNALAARFGGGGHPAAAGAKVEGDYEEVKRLVFEEAKAYLREGA